MAIAHRRSQSGSSTTLVWSVIAAAWLLALLLPAAGHGGLVSHHAVLGGIEAAPASTLLLALAAWQAMTGAMMLPSSLPMILVFARVSAGQPHPRRALAAFLVAYFAVWTGFAGVALAGDAGFHRLVHAWAWLDERPWLVAGSVLVLAGAFQFSPLKERCLDACRNPVQFVWRYYDRGVPAAWRLGVQHGLFCLGCCWALMLTMFAVGVGSLVWMAGLTGVMVIEKTTRWGRRLVPLVGGGLLVWGGLVLLQPGWLPGLLRLT